MNIKEVKDLIQEVLQSDITEFELEHTGTKVRLRRGSALSEPTVTSPAAHVMTGPSVSVSEPRVSLSGTIIAPAVVREEAAAEEGLHLITSPIVGTFYRSPSPGADPFIKLGSKIDVGTILCIVEAMKLMNEIPSDIAGEVAEIYVENGHPVEFGQRLFGIRPRK